ncbi:ubiquitin receptor RAD23c-like isoform X1 [Curcuma longa]|uniref:ubiquitin receptor RAD23c-like isoform X1 n=1 Tax=Curcuma longa TaxID=136217 RepID=UPI003D9EC24F
MRLSVKTLKGTSFQIDANPGDTVVDVKKSIETSQGESVYPAVQQMLIHEGKILKDDTTLADNKISDNSFLVIMLSKCIPENAEASTIAQAPPSRQTLSSTVEAPPAVQPSVPSSGPNSNPLDLLPQSLPLFYPDAGEDILDLRSLIQANPQILQRMLQELGNRNPELMRLFQEHQGEFLRLINQPAEGTDAEGNLLGQLEALSVAIEERKAIERLELLGFSRAAVLQAFIACDKNEELAAEYLLDHVLEFQE